MKETLEHLVELQDLEDALRELRVGKQKQTKLSAENAETRTFFEGLLTGLQGQIEETQAFCKEKRAEIEESESNARRARQRMAAITSQRELNALNKEIEISKRQNQTRNEELAKLTEQLTATQEDYEEKTRNFEALCTQMTEVEEELTNRLEARAAEATTQRNRQEEIRSLIDRPTLSRFDRILNARDGVAVADVSNEVCSACRMAVQPQVFLRIMAFKSIEQCHSCKRILVYRKGLVPEDAVTMAVETAAAE